MTVKRNQIVLSSEVVFDNTVMMSKGEVLNDIEDIEEPPEKGSSEPDKPITDPSPEISKSESSSIDKIVKEENLVSPQPTTTTPVKPRRRRRVDKSQGTQVLPEPVQKEIKTEPEKKEETKKAENSVSLPKQLLGVEFNNKNTISIAEFAVDINQDLTGINYISTGSPDDPETLVIQLFDGRITQRDKTSEKPVERGRIKKPFTLTEMGRKRYFAIAADIIFRWDRKELLTETVLRFIEASISCHVSQKPNNPTFFKRSEDFLTSNEEMLLKFWLHTVPNQNRLIAIGDELGNMSLAIYTNALPPFREITRVEALGLIQNFIERIFKGNIPPHVRGNKTTTQFLDHLCIKQGLSKRAFGEDLDKVGVPFENGFASLEKGAEGPELLSYGFNTYVTGNIIRAPYKWPVFKNNTIVMSEGCKVFLENLCHGDTYIYSVIRGLFRAVILSKYEGKDLQSAIWICGPPACSKSLIVRVLKRLLPSNKIMEFSHELNNFSNSALVDRSLIVLSDIVNLSAGQFKALKPILGRDQIRIEIKYEPVTNVTVPSAIIVATSNYTPEEINYLKTDEATLEKLIVVQFPPDASIPPELQQPDVENMIDSYLPEIMNWAIHAPISVVRNMIRATNYRNHVLKKANVEEIGGLPGFLRDHFLYSKDEKDFTPLNDFKLFAARKQEELGDNLLQNITKGNNFRENSGLLGRTVEKCSLSFFGKEVKFCKYPRRDRSSRPMGFKNLVLKPVKGKWDPDLYETFEFRSERQDLKLDEPFYSEQKVIWLSNTINKIENFEQAQRDLQAYRKAQRGTKTKLLAESKSPVEDSVVEIVETAAEVVSQVEENFPQNPVDESKTPKDFETEFLEAFFATVEGSSGESGNENKE